MQKRKLVFDYNLFDSIEELSSVQQKLMHSAIAARKDAYAPYSKFHVGAAVLLKNGKTVIGSNQENASYPAGVCAERVAILYAGAKYPGVAIVAIAITATSKNHKVDAPVTSCGICRQSMAEYEQKQKTPIEILMMGEIGQVIQCNSVLDLIPFAFDSAFL
ncbi:cytidine deaminase [Aurantibacter crassamenti]|uniref:cytidine deaminase n=1 Tax=Aurantibacter crassamenti TaxID=1837375 RepID=UPI0019399A2F|nr:cytidine deaminase [Aurantibacter crassamenti]MBM1104610.1 cytidine deaminase [Aurantibacter crassamenti]